jgi:hypothetical protein
MAEKFEKNEPRSNPNSIAELISLGSGFETSEDFVYRKVNTAEAIDDLYDSGVVRNKHVAAGETSSRWGDRVFWSRGKTGKKHPIQPGDFVIVAEFAVANERQVTLDDVRAIYTQVERDGAATIVDVKKL